MPDDRSMMPSFACLVAADDYNTTVRPRPTLLLQTVKSDTPLVAAFQGVKSISSPINPLKALFVVCHGQYQTVGVDNASQIMAVGLGLGFEGIFAHNTVLWKPIKGYVQNIVIYGCDAARTPSTVVGTVADMKRTLGSLAIYSGSKVYGADRLQCADVRTQDVDFGPWEGTLFEFLPSGAPPRPVKQAPYNLSDV
jgi:hypothetical protein